MPCHCTAQPLLPSEALFVSAVLLASEVLFVSGILSASAVPNQGLHALEVYSLSPSVRTTDLEAMLRSFTAFRESAQGSQGYANGDSAAPGSSHSRVAGNLPADIRWLDDEHALLVFPGPGAGEWQWHLWQWQWLRPWHLGMVVAVAVTVSMAPGHGMSESLLGAVAAGVVCGDPLLGYVLERMYCNV